MLNYNKEILVFDDLDLTNVTDELYAIVTTNEFPWYFLPRTVKNPDPYDKQIFNEYDHLTHVFIIDKTKNSEYMSIPIKMLDVFSEKSGIKFNTILRVQSNLILEKKFNKPSAPHIDCDDKHYVLLIYLNDSDGDTILFNDNMEEIKRITPKRGRFVLFDGSIKHSVIPPINTKHRIVFNYNLQ